MTLAVVTATINLERALPCLESWRDRSSGRVLYYIVEQGGAPEPWRQFDQTDQGIGMACRSPEILGVVPAFAIGVRQALQQGAEVIACFHDDLEIQQDGWDQDVLRLFKACPRAGLCGFGGARGLGDDLMYHAPYAPMQLARQSFGSNMRDAEAHGVRWESAQPVACLDGFSQIGLANFWRGVERQYELVSPDAGWNLFTAMQDLGVVHHMYDGMLGCYAKRLGYQTWFLPVRCHHHGGLTAVADPRYHDWATAQLSTTQRPNYSTGDQYFWELSHLIAYQEFRDVLPLRT